MGCSGVKTGFPRRNAEFARFNVALPAGADKTNSAVAMPITNRFRRMDASRLIRLALGLQWVSNSTCPSLTRFAISAEGTNRFKAFGKQKTTGAVCASKMWRASSSSGECHPPTKAASLNDANCFNSCELFNARSESICRAEMTPSSRRSKIVESPKPQIFAGLLSKKAPRLAGGSISQISKPSITLFSGNRAARLTIRKFSWSRRSRFF